MLWMNGGTTSDFAEAEGVMYRALRSGSLAGFNDDRDVELARTLSDRDHIHCLAGKRTEQPGGNTRSSRHAQPDHGDGCQVRSNFDGVDLPPLELGGECVAQCRRRGCPEAAGNPHADRMLGRCLGDKRDRNARALERTECARRHTGHPDHSVAGDRQQRLICNRRQRFHRSPRAANRGFTLTLDDDLGAVCGRICVRADNETRPAL